MLKKVTNNVMRKIGLLIAGVSASGLAMADAPAAGAVDYSALTSHISWTGVTTAVLGICGGLAAVYVAMRGAKMVLGVLRRG